MFSRFCEQVEASSMINCIAKLLSGSAGLALAAAPVLAASMPPKQEQPKVARPVQRPTLADTIKRYLQRLGATVDEAKSTPDMVVSNYPDTKGGKITIVMVNDRRKNLLGFYIYNFGNIKNAADREAIYRYLLSANNEIAIGAFFVDSDQDIGYKYLVSLEQPISLATFESIYLKMAAVAHDRRPEIRKLLGAQATEK
jgi:hypothetical protein